jgi:hypothetical protein
MPGSGVVTVVVPASAAALESIRARSDDEGMNLLGRVENGVIVLNLPMPLPEGARVSVSFPAESKHPAAWPSWKRFVPSATATDRWGLTTTLTVFSTSTTTR